MVQKYDSILHLFLDIKIKLMGIMLIQLLQRKHFVKHYKDVTKQEASDTIIFPAIS
jgi:hypothetical protein